MIDRDLDWLLFNKRVLDEAEDTNNPIFERLKFLAIFSSNLDEFFRVRVSKLRQIKKVDKKLRKPLALKPNKLLKQILKRVDELQNQFGKIYRELILPELNNYGINIIGFKSCNNSQKAFLHNYFNDKIKKYVSILKDDVSRTMFRDGCLYLCVSFKYSDELAFLSVPVGDIDRFLLLPLTQDNKHDFIFLEDVIKQYAKELVGGQPIEHIFLIKLSRDAELYLEDDYEGEWIQHIYDSLKERQTGQPTRLLFEGGMPKHIQKRLRKKFDLGKIDMIEGGERHNFSDFIDFPKVIKDESAYISPMPPIQKIEFETSNDLFGLIRERDRVLHFPYQSFSYVEDFLFQASQDSSVTSIQISLYRIAKTSRLSQALLAALRNNKEVVIFIEAKARFDESNNLQWGKAFEEKGAKVFYSFKDIKVHSKIFLVERKEHGQLRRYGYIGTGNFNAKTAKIYCDHALLTADKTITDDLNEVFRVLKREVEAPMISTLLVSPYTTRTSFESLIRKEITNAKLGLPAKITAKMNSLEDSKMIELLYEASSFGVEIRLIVRGFCCLDKSKDLENNIEITSIVDRFLEHDRVFLFHNNGNEKMYLGSADWMTRNLDKRIEVLVPIKDMFISHKLLDILDLQSSDNVKARVRTKNNRYQKVLAKKGVSLIRSQYAIYSYLKEKEFYYVT